MDGFECVSTFGADEGIGRRTQNVHHSKPVNKEPCSLTGDENRMHQSSIAGVNHEVRCVDSSMGITVYIKLTKSGRTKPVECNLIGGGQRLGHVERSFISTVN
jgi:hypothetical protein